MEITDQFYSNLNDGEVQNRISALGKTTTKENQEDMDLIREFLKWRNRKYRK